MVTLKINRKKEHKNLLTFVCNIVSILFVFESWKWKGLLFTPLLNYFLQAALTDPLSSCVGNDSTDNSRDTFEGITPENEYSDSGNSFFFYKFLIEALSYFTYFLVTGSHNYEYTPQFTKPEESRTKKRKIVSNGDEFDDCMTRPCESSQQTLKPDELSLYGELLIRKLRGLSLRTRKIVMNQIDNIVFQAEIKELEQQTVDTQVSSVHSICKVSPPSCSSFDI